MIATTIQKILDKQELSVEERLELVYWFERLQNAPTQLDSLFSGGSARITAASQITPNMGVMTAGKFVTPAMSAVSNIPTEAGFTGSFMSGNGEVFNSETFNIGGVNAGVLQWGAKQSDGTLTAGGGVIGIDENGFSIDTPAVAGDQYSYKFTRGGSAIGGLYANQLGADSNLIQLYGTSSVFPRVQITSRATDQTTGAGQVWLLATLQGAITTYAEIILSASPTGSSIVLNSGLWDTDTIVRGDTDANLIHVDASTDRVGIGTASPGYKLDVAGTVNVSTGNTYKINGTDVLSSTATGRTQEEIEDFVGAMVSSNTETGISVTYDDTNGKLNFDAQTAGDARYAPIAKGVTNGDSHNHVGGDGAALNYTDVIAAFWNSVTVPASTTYYGAPFKVGVDVTQHQVPWAEGGTLSNMSVRISTNQPASGSLVVTLQVNGADTSIVATVAAGTTGPATASDNTNTASLSATDTLRWKVVNNATGASAALTSVSMLNTKQTT